MPVYRFNQPTFSIDNSPDFRTERQKQLSPANIYNPDVEDLAMAERMAEELCNISGAFINVYLRVENEANVDDVFKEDSDPTYDDPVMMKGVWRPEPLKTELTKWGADATNVATIAFSRATVIKKLRRPVRAGDILAAPQNQILQDHNLDQQQDLLFYRVLDAQNDGNYRFRWLYWKCIAEPILGDRVWIPRNRSFNGDI